MPAGVDARLDREWYITETNASGTAVDVGVVDIRFDLSSYTTPTVASDLRLLIDADADGALSDEAAISGASLIGGSIYAFTGVTGLVNGTTFTLGTANSTQTPLPVELIHFGVQTVEHGALITWSTASEVNHAYFTVERSTDGEAWVGVAAQEGTGDHATTRAYRYLDKVDPGMYFYRLRQVDLDGSTQFSEVKRVVVKESSQAKNMVFPNPAYDRLFIAKDAMRGDWQLIALDGIRQDQRLILMEESTDYHVYSLEGLKPGYYIFNNHSGLVQKVLIQR